MTPRKGLLLFFALAFALLVGSAYKAPALVHTVVVNRLTDMGLGPVELRIDALNLHETRLTGLSLARDGVTLKELALRYSLPGLLRAHIDDVNVVGLSVRGRLVEGKPVLPILDVLGGGQEGEGASLPSVGHVNLESAELSFDGAEGNLAVSVTGSLDRESEATYRTGFGVRLVGDYLGGKVDIRSTWHGKVPAAFPHMRTEAAIEGRLFATLSNLTVDKSLTAVSLQGQFDVSLTGGTIKAAVDGPMIVAGLLGGTAIDGPVTLTVAPPSEVSLSETGGAFSLIAGMRGGDGLAIDVTTSGKTDFAKVVGKADIDFWLARLVRDGINAEALSGKAALEFNADEGGVRIEATGPAFVAIGGLTAGTLGRLNGPLSVPISAFSGTFPYADRSIDFSVQSQETAFDMTLEGERISGRLPRFSLDEKTLRADGGRIETAYLAPLFVAVNAGYTEPSIPFSGTIGLSSGVASVEFEGGHDPVSGAGELRFALPPLFFSPELVQPKAISPLVPKHLGAVVGQTGAGGTIGWTKKGLSADVDVLIKDLSFDFGDIKVDKVNTVLKIDGLSPLHTPERQEVAIGSVMAVLPLTDGLFRLQAKENALMVESGRISIAGGEISIKPTRLDFDGTPLSFDLSLSGLNLSDVTALAELDGLETSGLLDGTVPLRFETDSLSISGGGLRNRHPGRIRYRPSQPPNALQGGGEGVNLMLQALENFHFHKLEAGLDGIAGKDLILRLHLAGKNPDLYGGHPLEFNLNLSGALDSIVRQTLDTANVPASIQKRIDDFAKRHLERN